ncbi:MAG: hypothetical protein IJN39_00030, partial [Clostridia bacterium]|nr:hypothetical protein [Clostridia bacterium]
AMLEDFLITSVWAKSDGKIEFPSYTDTGYAYFHSRQYGGEAGKFYDEDDMWLWLDRGILTSSSKNTDYIAARKDGVLALSFVNEGNESESVTITLGEKAPSYTGNATLIDADGTKSEISVENGIFTLDLPAKGLKSVIINSDEVSAPKHAASPMSVDESATSSVHTCGKGYVLQLDNSRYFAYTYITDKPDTVKSASITYTAGDKTETLTDSVYPYEFIVEVESPYTPFEYEITATLTDDSKDARGKAVLRPVNYTEFPEILNETSNGGLITADIGNASATPENSQIFLALFDSSKNLLQSEIKSVSASDTSVEFKTYNLDFATAKLFLWNNMRPLCESKSFNKGIFNAAYEEFEPFVPIVSTVGRTGTHWRFVVGTSQIPFDVDVNSMTGMAITVTFTPKAGGTAKTYDAYISSNEMKNATTTIIVVPESTEFPTSDEWAVDHTQTIKIYPY